MLLFLYIRQLRKKYEKTEKEKKVICQGKNMKVSILGAGPTGSTAAYYLAKEGIDVELIDKREFPRDKPCGGGLFNPPLFYKEFPHVKEIEGKYIYKTKFYCGKYFFEYESKDPLMKTCFRKDFDYFLLKKAMKEGAKLLVRKRPEPEGGIVINATGARRIKDYPEAGICLVNDFRIEKEIDTVYIHYGFHGIKGYAWLYPKEGYANIGIGAYLPQKSIKRIYESYIDFLEEKDVAHVQGKSYSAKIIPFSSIKNFYTENSLIAGDAAGFVRPGTGEGIYFAMLSGKIAARTIIEEREFAWYEKQCRKEIGVYLKSAVSGLSGPLVNKILEKAVKIACKDETFKKMLVENFFRLRYYRFGVRFFRNILK